MGFQGQQHRSHRFMEHPRQGQTIQQRQRKMQLVPVRVIYYNLSERSTLNKRYETRVFMPTQTKQFTIP